MIINAGIEIEDISIMHFNRDYVKHGAIVPNQLFTHESVFTRMQSYLSEIPENIATFLEVYQREEQTILIGGYCNKTYACEFENYCHTLRENQAILKELRNAPKLSTKISYNNMAVIQAFLEENAYSIYSFDFKTVMDGIPKYDNARPYEQIPFQYSLHYQKDANTAPLHYEFSGNGADDPRKALIQQMIKYVAFDGNILCITFRLKENE